MVTLPARPLPAYSSSSLHQRGWAGLLFPPFRSSPPPFPFPLPFLLPLFAAAGRWPSTGGQCSSPRRPTPRWRGHQSCEKHFQMQSQRLALIVLPPPHPSLSPLRALRLHPMQCGSHFAPLLLLSTLHSSPLPASSFLPALPTLRLHPTSCHCPTPPRSACCCRRTRCLSFGQSCCLTRSCRILTECDRLARLGRALPTPPRIHLPIGFSPLLQKQQHSIESR
mmetsp:Transcript_16053/g.40591  ORF Transcript_16053/g.40591 Transcript_16053/m.40591 type:complete len:223 (-) Transcript_16053:613-1281(-)